MSPDEFLFEVLVSLTAAALGALAGRFARGSVERSIRQEREWPVHANAVDIKKTS